MLFATQLRIKMDKGLTAATACIAQRFPSVTTIEFLKVEEDMSYLRSPMLGDVPILEEFQTEPWTESEPEAEDDMPAGDFYRPWDYGLGHCLEALPDGCWPTVETVIHGAACPLAWPFKWRGYARACVS